MGIELTEVIAQDAKSLHWYLRILNVRSNNLAMKTAQRVVLA